jgi:hypothetical protein
MRLESMAITAYGLMFTNKILLRWLYFKSVAIVFVGS